MYMNMLHNDEATLAMRPVSLLINNPNIEVLESMTNRRIPIHELIGKTFSRWIVLSEAKGHVSPKGKKYRKMHCRCECGNDGNVFLDGLRSGVSKSCGCLMIETTKKNHTKHGMNSLSGKTRIYNVWANMKSRCYQESNTRFNEHGGRGIRVYAEWLEFIPFRDWALSNGYSDDKYMDREQVDGNYEPDNCRFVSIGLSNRNTQLLRKTNRSGYRGVSFVNNKYTASITYNSKSNYLGRFTDPIEAAEAYDTVARELNDGRPLNFPERRSQ